jgi:hypothetical protein
VEREVSPTACIIDSQSVKSAEKSGAFIDIHGFDAGKLIKGKKRHILVDMQGLLLHAIIHSAGIQDRDGGISLLATLFGQFLFLKKLFADRAYAGCIFDTALTKILPNLKTEIVKRSDQAKRFGYCPSVGSSNAQSLGSTVAADWPRIGKISIATLSLSSNSLPSASCYASCAILDKVSGRTLRPQFSNEVFDLWCQGHRPCKGQPD